MGTVCHTLFMLQESFSITGFNPYTAARETLHFVNETSRSRRSTSYFLCVDPYYTRLHITLSSPYLLLSLSLPLSNSSGWSPFSFVQQFSSKGLLLGAFSLLGAASRSVSLFWDDGESSALVPLTFHLVTPVSPFDDLIAFLLPSDRSAAPRAAVWLSGSREKTVWHTVWTEPLAGDKGHVVFMSVLEKILVFEAFYNGKRMLLVRNEVISEAHWKVNCEDWPIG